MSMQRWGWVSMWFLTVACGTATPIKGTDAVDAGPADPAVGALIGIYNVGGIPVALTFDGTNIWVLNSASHGASVSKLRASDGAFIGNYPVTVSGQAVRMANGIGWDGADLWVTSGLFPGGPADQPGFVTRMSSNSGAEIASYAVNEVHPESVAFDGTNTWVVIPYSNKVAKLVTSTGELIDTYPIGAVEGHSYPTGLAYDGTNIWTANQDGTVTKLVAATGALVGTYPAVTGASGIAFDGTHIWVAGGYQDEYNPVAGMLAELLPSTGATVATFPLGMQGSTNTGVVFQGGHVWVTNRRSGTVTAIDVNSGGEVNSYVVPDASAITSDGTNIWVTSTSGANVYKLKG